MTYDHRYASVTEEDAYEAVFSYANHNKRIPPSIIEYLRDGLLNGSGPSWASRGKGPVYRGDVNDQAKVEKDIQGRLDNPEGERNVTLHMTPGSSWSYDYDQAKYHATSGSSNPQTEILYTANASRGSWLDLVELYKLSQFRGLRLEREVICLDSSVPCKAEWSLPR